MKKKADKGPWFRLDEREPAQFQFVLITDGHCILVGHRSMRGWEYDEDECLGVITHWMPLPELPDAMD